MTGPGGATLSGSKSDTIFGNGDLYPVASLKWNRGVSNFMTYVTGDIPVGSYESSLKWPREAGPFWRRLSWKAVC